MDNKFKDTKNNTTSIEKILKCLCFLLVLIVILLVVIFFKIDKLNKNILINYDSTSSSTSNEKYNDVLDVFYETTLDIGDKLPLYDETVDNSIDTSTSSKNVQNDTTTTSPSTTTNDSSKITYVINTNSKKMHYKTCSFVSRMKEENKSVVQLNKDELNTYLNSGYSFCSSCGG